MPYFLKLAGWVGGRDLPRPPTQTLGNVSQSGGGVCGSRELTPTFAGVISVLGSENFHMYC